MRGSDKESPERFKAAVFDLDGTLLYTLTSIAAAGNAVLRHFGYQDEPESAYRYYCGDGADTLVRRILDKAGDSNPAHFEEGCRLNREVLKANADLGVRPYEGLKEALSELRARGFLLGVCSNKPDNAVQEVIPEIFGPETFDAVCGQREGLRLKPSPDMPLCVARMLGVEPSECLYFGDTGTDMRTGRAAGMRTIGVLWGYRTEEELINNGAERLIRTPCEIPDLPGVRERR